MEAFLLAAGLGTRLRPLTNDRPKALVEVDGRTLLEINIAKLTALGATRIVVNIHHFADKMVHFIANHDWDTEICISDERGLLLDTGGALKKASNMFSHTQPILIHNVDILAQFDWSSFYAKHMESGTLATLAVSERSTSRLLMTDEKGLLRGWHNNSTGEYIVVNSDAGTKTAYRQLAFSGITLIEPKLLDLLPEASRPYPIIPEYLRLAKSHRINTFEHNPSDWLDVGKPETLAQATQFLQKMNQTS